MLLDKYSNGRIDLKSRLVFPPIGTHSANDDGTVSARTLEHYTKICSGSDIGLAYVEHCYVALSGRATPNQISLETDAALPGITKLAERIKADGTKAFLQLNHCGSRADVQGTGIQPMSASSDITVSGRISSRSREMTRDDINEMSCKFAAAALRVKKAGFDGVEIHSAHGYLFNQFYSPITNHRTDEYGGSRENRLRFLCETVSLTRAAVGEDFPISVRLGACDYMDGGITEDDGVYAARKLEQLGVDVLSVTGGLCGFIVPQLLQNRAYFEELTRKIKNSVSIPVICTGGITDPKVADGILLDGSADLVGVGRVVYKNSDWAKDIEL